MLQPELTNRPRSTSQPPNAPPQFPLHPSHQYRKNGRRSYRARRRCRSSLKKNHRSDIFRRKKPTHFSTTWRHNLPRETACLRITSRPAATARKKFIKKQLTAASGRSPRCRRSGTNGIEEQARGGRKTSDDGIIANGYCVSRRRSSSLPMLLS